MQYLVSFLVLQPPWVRKRESPVALLLLSGIVCHGCDSGMTWSDIHLLFTADTGHTVHCVWPVSAVKSK